MHDIFAKIVSEDDVDNDDDDDGDDDDVNNDDDDDNDVDDDDDDDDDGDDDDCFGGNVGKGGFWTICLNCVFDGGWFGCNNGVTDDDVDDLIESTIDVASFSFPDSTRCKLSR